MTKDDQRAFAVDAIPLKMGEIIAAAEMAPDLSCLPLEDWPGYRESCAYADELHSESSMSKIASSRFAIQLKAMLALC